MDQGRDISRRNPSISRGQSGQTSRRDDPVDNKDITNRRKCPDCDGRLSKESTKSKSRVWKKVMWFTRRSKAPKNDICQCQTSDGFIDSNFEDRHSNSWSFTRRASRKFRISSRKRQCKSESSKKSVCVQGKQDEACTSHESSLSSTHRGSLCSSGANSPTATGSFCDFGASSHAGGKRGSKRHNNTFVLTEIAREINPPVRNDDLKLSNIYHPRKRLTKSSSSVSHLSRSPMIGNVHRSKSFPGSHSYMSPPKRRFTSTPNTAFVTSSPPVKQRCYGLRRTATFCGKLNTEFPKLCMKKSKSVNNGELMKHGKSTSLGEIRDQSGSVVGIVHFYKSPRKLARIVSSLNREVKQDCMLEEEECQCPSVDQTSSNISQESSGTCLKTGSTISESQHDAGLLPKSSFDDEASQRNYEETRRDSLTPLEEISKSIVGAEDLSCFSNMNEEIHYDECSNQDKSTLCNTEPLVLSIDEPVQESCFDHKEGRSNISPSGSNYIDVNKGEVSVLNVNKNSENNHHDSTSGYSDTGLLSSIMTNQGPVSKNANNIEDISECEPSSIKDESLSTPLPSQDKINDISSLQTVSKTSEDDSSSAGPSHELLTKLPSSVASQQCSGCVKSESFNTCNNRHENLLQPELNPSLPTSEQTSEDGDLPCCLGDHVLNNCQVCDQFHGSLLETEPTSLMVETLETSEDLKSVYQDSDNVSDNYNESQLSATHMDASPMSHNGFEDFELETENKIVSTESEHHDFTNATPKSCRVNLNDTCIENASLLEESEDSFCSYDGSQSKTSTDNNLEDETSVNSSACSEIVDERSNIDDTCESNEINCGEKCLQSEVEITEQLDSSIAPGERDWVFHNDVKLSHNRPCVMCEDDLTLEVFDDQFRSNNFAVPNKKFQMHVHSSMITSSELKPSSPAISRNSASDPVDLCNENETNILSSQNWKNSRNLAMPVKGCEEYKVPCHSSTNSPEILECSRTSEYVSLFDESLSAPQSDVPIHTWKTSETDLKSDEIGLPVPGETFKKRTELMLSWFEEFNDEQRNIILKKILNRCELPQMHLLSVTMENNLHKTCPPNCQDMLVWLPYTVTLKVLMYLDPVSLCRCNQVNRAWNELTDNSLLWQRLTRSPEYQLSEASSRRQYQKFTQGNGEIHWKKVFAERFLLQRNWLNGKYKLRTFEGHNQGIACVQFDDTRIVSGSSDKTIKLWDISNTPSELMLTLEGHSGTVRCLDLNGNRLVSGSTDRTIKVWDLSFASYWAGASCKVTMVGHLHTVRCLQADEKKLVSGSYDKTVKVWDLKNGECQLTLRGHTAAVLCVQFDHQKIVSGSYDKKIKVWDLTEGTCLMTLDGHQDAVTCLNLTHDGMKIITGSLDYSLKFWDLSTGKCYGTLDWITSEGHTAVVRCLQVDSWRIVSGGDDKTLKVWELATGQRLLTLRYHSDGVTCMQFNDFAIVSGSYDRTVKLWDFTPKHSYLEAVT